MMTLNRLIDTLNEIRDEYGGECKVVIEEDWHTVGLHLISAVVWDEDNEDEIILCFI